MTDRAHMFGAAMYLWCVNSDRLLCGTRTQLDAQIAATPGAEIVRDYVNAAQRCRA